MSIDKAKEFKLITGANKDELRGYALSYIDRIAFLKRENANQKACLDMFAEQDGPEWVACSERMPEDRKAVLVWCFASDSLGYAHYSTEGQEWFMPEPQPAGYSHISHWMPLPGPPKGVAQ